MQQSILQRQLSHNRTTITLLHEQQNFLHKLEKKLFRKSDVNNPNTYPAFARLNVVRNTLRKNAERLQNLAELQIILKQAIRGN